MSVADLDNVALMDVSRVQDYRRRWMIVVGVNDYAEESSSGLCNLANAVSDAGAIFETLAEDYGFEGEFLCRDRDVLATESFDPDTRRRLADRSSGPGSREDIDDAFDRLSRVIERDDLFLFFYSGHGSNEGAGYLVPHGAKSGQHSSFYMYEELFDRLDSLRCLHKLLLFDCCFAGVTTRGTAARSSAEIDDRGIPPGGPSQATQAERPIVLADRLVVLAATNSWEVTPDSYRQRSAGGVHNSNNSAFTRSIVDALSEVSPGRYIDPIVLKDDIFKFVKAAFGGSGIDIDKLRPQSAEHGEGCLLLRRPGLRMRVPDTLLISAGLKEDHRETLTCLDGVPPLTWSLLDPPPGLSIRDAALLVRPSVLADDEILVTVRVDDADGNSAEQDVRIVIQTSEVTPPRIATKALPPAVEGRSYRTQLEFELSAPPYTVEAIGLPDGLTLSGHPARLIGQVHPTARADPVQRHVQISVADRLGQLASRTFRLAVLENDAYCEVPAGAFQVGCHPSAKRIETLRSLGLLGSRSSPIEQRFPPKEALLPRFLIRKRPVSNRDWQAFVDATDYAVVPVHWEDSNFSMERHGDHPVINLTLENVLAYCDWRGTRLPSALEWEKAARGPTGYLFPWGDGFNKDYCNGPDLFGVVGRLRTEFRWLWRLLTSVDQFPQGASPYGVLDMVGNAWERVQERVVSRGNWKQGYRGGAVDRGGENLLAFARLEDGDSLRWDGSKTRLEPQAEPIKTPIGFRDVVELDDLTIYPQGFVSIAPSLFNLPSEGRVWTTRRVELARYSVSNEEYAEFVRVTGHPAPRHWLEIGAGNIPLQERHLPVVNVSYQDALAFCRWKSNQFGHACRIASKRVWQVAVHGPGDAREGFSARAYPWGDNYDRFLCNGRDNGWGGPRPVHDLLGGVASCGAFNLIGNVAEWAAEGLAIGGSWMDDCREPNTWFRNCQGSAPDVGFRYMREQAAEDELS